MISGISNWNDLVECLVRSSAVPWRRHRSQLSRGCVWMETAMMHRVPRLMKGCQDHPGHITLQGVPHHNQHRYQRHETLSDNLLGTSMMPSKYYDQYHPTWCLKAVPRQQNLKCLSLLTLRFGAVLCQMAAVICFAWAYTEHEKPVAYIDGLGSAWSSINLGAVSLAEYFPVCMKRSLCLI